MEQVLQVLERVTFEEEDDELLRQERLDQEEDLDEEEDKDEDDYDDDESHKL